MPEYRQDTPNIWFIDQKEPIHDPIDPISDYQFKEYWKRERERCINGFYLADDKVYISGWLYFHTVYWRIVRYVTNPKTKRKSRKITVPLLRDIDWDIINDDFLQCEQWGKFYALVGSRDFGKSVVAASRAGWIYTFFDNSESVISGGEKKFIKLATDKIEDGLTNLHPIFKKQRISSNWQEEVKAGWKDQKTNQPHEKSSNSRILVRNYDGGTKTMAANGTRPQFHLIDEIGTIPNLIGCIKDSDGCWWSGGGIETELGEAVDPENDLEKETFDELESEEGDKASCVAMFAGTGGDMEVGAEAGEIFFDPEPYNILSFENPEQPGRRMGRFISALRAKMKFKEKWTLAQYLNIDHPDLKKITILVSNEEKALKEWWEPTYEKTRKSGNQKTITKFLAYWPIKPSDCFLVISKNDFNVEAAKLQKRKLEGLERTGTPIELYHNGERITHKFTDKVPITQFPLKDQDPAGCPVMYEAPISNAPWGLYVAGCLLPGEKVITDKGLMNVEDVSFSENLINKDGEKVNIVNLQRYLKNNTDVYSIRVSNTIRKTKFTGEHPLYVYDREIKASGKNESFNFSNFGFKEARNVKVGNWIKYPNLYDRESDLDIDLLWEDEVRCDFTINSPMKKSDFWWLVGLFLGDGWTQIRKRSYKVFFAINKKEEEYVHKLIDTCKRLFNREVVIRERNNCFECSICSKTLVKFLNKNFGKYAYGKFIPEWVKTINKELKYNLILGYLDSDGYVHLDGNRNLYTAGFVSINHDLLESFQDILFSLGMVSTMSIMREAGTTHFKNKPISITKKTYHLRIGNSDSIKIRKTRLHAFGKIAKIDLKTAKVKDKKRKTGCFLSEDNKYIYFEIKDIEKSEYTGWVYNFECETHTYICKHITTHNCDPYKQDTSKYSDSLGSIYIYKRMHSIMSEQYQDMIVAQYVGRPNSINTWNETVRSLIKYYNAIALCENEDYGFINYMIHKGDSMYLMEQPEWLKDITPNSSLIGRRQYGIPATPKIIAHLNGTYKTYTEEVVSKEVDENGSVIKENLGFSKILDPMLLEETIKFNVDGNFDRIRAASIAIAAAKHLDAQKIMVSTTDSDPRIKSYLNRQKSSGTDKMFGKSQTYNKEITKRGPSRIKRLFS